MKKIFALALAFGLSVGLAQPVCGAGDEVIGHALYTEIVAEIDGKAIASYNVAGRTAVMAADLAQYGFYVYWDGEAGVAYIWPGALKPGGITEQTPDFVPQPPEGKVGDPAYPIYASDVKVYVAGEEKESFNIGGHVMVYLSDLEAYGDVTWKAEEKVAALQVAEDPAALALDRKEAELKASGLSYQFERYPGPQGILAVYSQGGTPHGRACMMLYVDRSGKQTRIDQLLPYYGFGQQYYLNPRDISFDETWNRLTFITPVQSQEGDWGDTRCTFDAGTGQIISMVPLGEELEQWDASCDTYAGQNVASGQPLEVTVTREAGGYEAVIQTAQLPWQRMAVTLGSGEISIVHESAGFEDNDAPYSRAFRALQAMGLPDISKEGFVQENTPEQRSEVGQYLQVTKNGQPVPGVLWWSRGNGHTDLKFTLDQNVSLAEGDVIRLQVGVTEEK